MSRILLVVFAGSIALLLAAPAPARPPIRADFFEVYPQLEGTQLDDLPSNTKHCGVCHFDFDGGGSRTPYGLAIEIGIAGGLTNHEAAIAIETDDSDGDSFTNLVEITDFVNFPNTPTFPGLSASNQNSTSHIPLAEIAPYLTPSGGSDVTPPTVTLFSPVGGEHAVPHDTQAVMYSATDASGISHVNFQLSDDGGSSWKTIGRNESNTGLFAWFVPNLPGSQNRIRVEAVDGAGNPGFDASPSDFTIGTLPYGRVPTTLRDMELAGTQPFEGAVLDDAGDCRTCHGDYDSANEPWHNWQGSMMGQAMRDPLFLACLAVAEQDAPSVGDLCLRCHTPGGWQEGRSVDTGGGMVNAKDRQAIQCDFCHRMVDPVYQPGLSPPEDQVVLSALDDIPAQYGNGEFVNDPLPLRRGPFADAAASHAFLESPFHRESDLCGTCHNVSNPVFVRTGERDYEPAALDEEHPDGLEANMFPVERTFAEWTESEYASTGVLAPQFAGNKPDGIVSSCQDCHMRDVDAKGCNENGVSKRPDLPLHDFMGGNAFIPDILPLFYPTEVDLAALADGKARAISMLQLAATLEAFPEPYGVRVRVWNETGHKLPSGYPEGRRIWLDARAVDHAGQPVFASGQYDGATGDLLPDEQIKVYEIKPGLSPGLAAALNLPSGPSFHFVLNDTVYADNRIPPRGFTNAGFETIQSPVVAYTYPDGQYWDDTQYFLPAAAETAHVTLYYQTLSKEYVTFLRDENTTNSAGQDLYDAWETTGKSTPVAMASITIPLDDIVTASGEPTGSAPGTFALDSIDPDPFRTGTRIAYSVPEISSVRVAVYDVAGRLVSTLASGPHDPDRYAAPWRGTDDRGRPLPAGVYFVRMESDRYRAAKKVILLR